MAEAIGSSDANLSRVISGKQGYTQELLEACAEELQTHPANLISADPGASPSIWEIWDKASDNQREKILNIAKVIVESE